MDTKLLIDAIMRQTTVLIAQLSSAAGMRAPLAHLADEVFLHLSQELESQGVSRKIVADMFGLALRGYQKRVQRLRESATDGGRTLWRAVLEFIQAEGRVTRRRLLERFQNDDALAVGAVVNDLLTSGLVFKTGSGNSVVYGATQDEDRLAVAQAGSQETAASLVWLEVCRHPAASVDELGVRLGLDRSRVENALSTLEEQGCLKREAGQFIVEPMVIPVGATAGWEVAVFDHFQAVCVALATKVRQGRPQSTHGDTTGGATLTFDLAEGHPYREEVKGLLARIRRDVNELWERVEARNAEVQLSEVGRERVTFYFGQFTSHQESEG
jgi:predicted ArsR family transcriptional regulator